MNHERALQHKLLNWTQTALMLLGMGLTLGAVGWLIAGPDAILWAVIGAAVLFMLGPQLSPRLILAMYGARPLQPADAPRLYAVLEELARRTELDTLPTLYHVPSAMLNAFTVGTREDAAIAVTDGLLRQLNLRELIGVLAHEVSHVSNNDMRVMALADMLSRLTRWLSLFGQILVLIMLPLALFTDVAISWVALLVIVFAPSVAALLQLALSRTREYDADLDAAALTGDPRGLASALAKLERSQSNWLQQILFPGRRNPDPSLLRTHPPTQARIDRLLDLAGGAHLERGLSTDRPRPVELPRHIRIVTRRPRRHLNGLWH